MKSDKRLKTLCEEFPSLEETEKDYILGISQALAQSVFEKDTVPLPVARMIGLIKNQNRHLFHKE